MLRFLIFFPLYFISIQSLNATTLVDDLKVNYLTSFHGLSSSTQWPTPSTGLPLTPPLYDSEREKIIGLAGKSIYTMPPTTGHHTLIDEFDMISFMGIVRHPLTQELYTVGIKGSLGKAESDGSSPQTLYDDAVSGDIINDVRVLPIFDDIGNLYFMDSDGESLSRLWRFNSDETLTTIFEFPTGPAGQYSHANGFILSDGLIYGLLGYRRGIPYLDMLSTGDEFVVGALYRLNPNSSAEDKDFTVLHEFTLKEGEIPWDFNKFYFGAYLIEDDQGYLYGGTSVGTCETSSLDIISGETGKTNNGVCGGEYGLYSYQSSGMFYEQSIFTEYPHIDSSNPYGSIYRVKKDGSDFTLLHTFSDTDGSQPRGPMAIVNGYLYGTTMGGGDHRTDMNVKLELGETYPEQPLNMTLDGTIYRIDLNSVQTEGREVINSGFEHVHSFKSGPDDDTDGKVPTGLRLADNGRLYGVTRYGGRGYITNNLKHYQFDIGIGTLFEVDLTASVPGGSVNISATPAAIEIGESTELVWSSVNTSDCIPTGGAEGDGWAQDSAIEIGGSITLSPEAGTYYYTLNCYDEIKGGRVGNVTTVTVSTEGKITNSEHLEYGNGGSMFYLLLLSPFLFALKKRLLIQKKEFEKSNMKGFNHVN